MGVASNAVVAGPLHREMAALVRDFDWGRTAVGRIATWPASLATMVNVVMATPSPTSIWWGSDLIAIYNDAFRDLIGDRHPLALGAPAADVWADLWGRIGPAAKGASSAAVATRAEEVPAEVGRGGRTTEGCWTFTFAPIRGQGEGCSGLLVTLDDATGRVRERRRRTVVADVGARAANAKSAAEVCAAAARVLDADPADAAVALFFLLEGDAPEGRLVASAGQAGTPSSERRRLAAAALAGREASGEPAVCRSLVRPGASRPYGAVVLAPGPRRTVDPSYVAFVDRVAESVSGAIARLELVDLRRRLGMLAREAEVATRAREELLAILGHELRNPLSPPLTALQLMRLRGTSAREQEVIERQIAHLARLVDDLLDVSRITRRTVEDEGAGMSPDVIDPFVQKPQANDRADDGLGPGLAIVKSLVELHGGAVTTRSAGPGEGSELTVELPAADREPEAPRAPQAEHVRDERRTRILVVDDNDDAAEILKEALEGLGYAVRTAHDGPSALEVASSFHPEVALLDIGLPVMDGYELAYRLDQARAPDEELHLVALTGYGQQSDRERSAAAGFERHLVKPVDLSYLERVVEELHPSS